MTKVPTPDIYKAHMCTTVGGGMIFLIIALRFSATILKKDKKDIVATAAEKFNISSLRTDSFSWKKARGQEGTGGREGQRS